MLTVPSFCCIHLSQASTVYQFHNICTSQPPSQTSVINTYRDLACGLIAAHVAVVHLGYRAGVSDYNCSSQQRQRASQSPKASGLQLGYIITPLPELSKKTKKGLHAKLSRYSNKGGQLQRNVLKVRRWASDHNAAAHFVQP